ncbi:MAG: BamA/TamA family outer membrane protein [Bacteriovoracales bacterium]|nr:BamA/TamA family outer membrane protein [Bacteriovoracales bacterium]
MRRPINLKYFRGGLFLRLIFLIFIFFMFSSLSRATPLIIENIFLDCDHIGGCIDFEKRIEKIKRKYTSREKLIDDLENIKISLGRNKMFYTITTKKNKARIYLEFDPVLTLGDIIISSKNNIDLSGFLLPKKGNEFARENIPVLIEKLKIFLGTKGYEKAKIKYVETLKDGQFSIKIYIDEGSMQILKTVEIISDKNLSDLISHKFKKFEGKSWDKSSFDVEVSNIVNFYQNEGHYLFKMEIKEIKRDMNDFITPVLLIDFGPKFGIDIKGNQTIPSFEIINTLKEMFFERREKLNKAQIEKVIQELYFKKGVYLSKISIVKKNFVSENILRGRGVIKIKGGHEEIEGNKRQEVGHYFISIKEGHRFFLDEINFRGNKRFSKKELKKFFYEKGSLLSRRGYLDERNAIDFVERLKKIYLMDGFVFIKIYRPEIKKNKKNKKAKILYRIVEGEKVLWDKFSLKGIPLSTKKIIIQNIQNKEGENVNLIALRGDIDQIERNLREEGYFFSEILNKNSTNVIQYSKDYSGAILNLDIFLGKMMRFNDVVIVGLEKTHSDVIEREVFLKNNDKITPSKIDALRYRVSKLGLFSSVSVSPFLIDPLKNQTNILISVREKKFGFFEFAPGFRSDIGFKVSTTLGHNNLFGENHAITFKSQINQRLDSDSFDERRYQNKILEFKTSIGYDWRYFLSYSMDISTLFSFSRRRFRSFDTDIARGSLTLSKKWTSRSSGTIRYQFEHNKQFDAINSADEGRFSLGLLMPGVTFDFRDREINPSSGSLFNFSFEFARPYLGSQEGEKSIRYDKMIFRNAFYFPLNKNLVLALSFNTGVQKNLSRETPIPNIKVFRLNGIDRIRGFASYEINQLDMADSGHLNIDDVDIDDKLYFVNFKLEPRYYLSDSFVFSPFLDAGRLMMPPYRPFHLKTALGMGLKFVTPVGVLNFDYGMKLKRDSFGEGESLKKESFGRFHFTLGVF